METFLGAYGLQKLNQALGICSTQPCLGILQRQSEAL